MRSKKSVKLLLVVVLFAIGIIGVNAVGEGDLLSYQIESDSSPITVKLSNDYSDNYVGYEETSLPEFISGDINSKIGKITVKQSLSAVSLDQLNDYILFGDNISIDKVTYYSQSGGGSNGPDTIEKLIIETNSTIKLRLYREDSVPDQNLEPVLLNADNMNQSIFHFLYIDIQKYNYTFDSNGYLVVSVKKQPLTYVDSNVIVTLEDKLNGDYTLSVTELKNSNLVLDGYKFVKAYDIHIYDKVSGASIPISNTKVEIKIPLESKEYDKYVIAYVEDGKIKEKIDAIYENGYITFSTTHLSDYIIYGKVGSIENKEPVPETSDNVILYFALASISGISLIGLYFKKLENN